MQSQVTIEPSPATIPPAPGPRPPTPGPAAEPPPAPDPWPLVKIELKHLSGATLADQELPPQGPPAPPSGGPLHAARNARRRRRQEPDPHQYRRRDAAVVPRLRHERDRGPRAARYSRRPEAGASAHPLRHAARWAWRPTGPPRKCAKIVGEVHGQVPPARRLGHLRRLGAHGAALLHALPAGGRPGQLRLGGWRPAGGHAVHRGAACRASPPRCSRTSTRKRSISGPTTTTASRSPRSCPRAFPTCW